jgi:hypothetical protein
MLKLLALPAPHDIAYSLGLPSLVPSPPAPEDPLLALASKHLQQLQQLPDERLLFALLLARDEYLRGAIGHSKFGSEQSVAPTAAVIEASETLTSSNSSPTAPAGTGVDSAATSTPTPLDILKQQLYVEAWLCALRVCPFSPA